MRAIIIDDEPSGIKALNLLLNKYAEDVRVVAFATAASEGIALIENYRPEIVFLDIKMPFLDGFGLLEQLSYRSFYLVFTTAYEEFALRALKNNALDYLLKPIDSDDLIACLDRIRAEAGKKVPELSAVLQQMSAGGKARVSVPIGDGLAYVHTDRILRLEADSNYTRIYLMDSQVSVTAKTLKEYEKLLCNDTERFMRVHQSHIINLEHASRYLREDNLIVMKDESRVPLAKSKRADFLKWLNL